MSAEDATAEIATPAEPRCLPSAEEMRMVRAIALLALLEAARHGAYRATFHGFRVESVRRNRLRDSTSSIEVRLDVTLGGAVVESCELAVDRMRAELAAVEHRSAGSADTETFVDADGH